VSAISRDRDARKAEAVATKLRAIDYATLQDEWRRLHRVPAPKRVSHNLLMLGVAWKIQERAYGGLSAIAKRRLAELQTWGEAHPRMARPYYDGALKWFAIRR
jgi:hypothetical protein